MSNLFGAAHLENFKASLDERSQAAVASAIEKEIRGHFVIGANKAYAVTRLFRKAHYILVTGLDRQMAKDMLFDGAVDTVEEALAAAEKYVGKDYSVVLMPTGSLTVPLVEG